MPVYTNRHADAIEPPKTLTVWAWNAVDRDSLEDSDIDVALCVQGEAYASREAALDALEASTNDDIAEGEPIDVRDLNWQTWEGTPGEVAWVHSLERWVQVYPMTIHLG